MDKTKPPAIREATPASVSTVLRGSQSKVPALHFWPLAAGNRRALRSRSLPQAGALRLHGRLVRPLPSARFGRLVGFVDRRDRQRLVRPGSRRRSIARGRDEPCLGRRGSAALLCVRVSPACRRRLFRAPAREDGGVYGEGAARCISRRSEKEGGEIGARG